MTLFSSLVYSLRVGNVVILVCPSSLTVAPILATNRSSRSANLSANFYLRKNNSNKESIPIPKQNINPNAESKSSRNDIHFFSDKNFNYTNVDFDSLSKHINNLNYSSVLQTNEPDTSLERFYSILYSGIEEHVPKRRPGTIQINKKKYPTWWSRQTIATVKQKEKLRKKKMCNDEPYKQLKKRCQKLIKTELKNYTKELQNKLKSNAKKEFWNFIKSKNKSLCKTEYILDGVVLSDPQIICNELATHFKSVYSTVQPRPQYL
uniref:Uncharacterized protein n=1 Tax=Cacopsylla melanoneura TaxID=428564 RepID=A0A8D9DZT0_9HEMI